MKVGYVVTGLLGASLAVGCRTTDSNNEISECGGDKTPIVATYDGDPEYNSFTDPVTLAEEHERRALEEAEGAEISRSLQDDHRK